VITVPVLRIDDPQQQQSLTETVKEHRPKLLVLDPFIRMHRIDENNSGEVSALLAYLRAINRMFHVAVALVHHSSKRGNIRAGQALRGSSEFHAWGDSFLYLQRQRDDGLYLTVEHRSESSKAAVALELQEGRDSLALRQRSACVPQQQQLQATDEDRILEILGEATSPITLEQIRVSSQLRRNTVCTIVKTLVEAAKATRTESGYQAATQ
jgi:RecA-family ATPase